MTKSAQLIEFLSQLHGMARIDTTVVSAFDLESGMKYRAHPSDSEGEILLIVGEQQNQSIPSHPVIEFLLLRHARAQADLEGGNQRSQYEHIRSHLRVKVGI